MTELLTLRLSQPQALDIALAGGKGMNLARLTAADAPVPEGFCITTRAFQEHLKDPETRAQIDALDALDIADPAAVARAGAALRERIEGRALPRSVQTAIEEAVLAYGAEHAYAVRSSATAEDLPDASFAGQQDSFLNIRGVEAIIDRARACMASLFTDRAIVYRAKNRVPHASVALAVVVQRMVNPDVSGVLFTADPVTGNRRVASLDATFGLGEALVRGDITADRIRVDRRTGAIIERVAGDKRVLVRALPLGGTEDVTLPPEQRNAPALSDELARALVGMGERIEAQLGAPQDIEWCVEAGRVLIVQARPITSLFPLLSPLPRDEALHVYLSWGHNQVMPEAMPPLVVELWRRTLALGSKPIGSTPSNLRAASAGGRVYADITPMLASPRTRAWFIDTLKGTDVLAQAALRELVRRPDIERLPRASIREVFAYFPKGAVTNLLRALRQRPEGAAARAERATDALASAAIAALRAPPRRADRVRAMTAILAPLSMDLLATAYPLVVGSAAETLLRRRFPEDGEDIDALGRGYEDDLVTQMNLALGDVADVARAHPAVAEALRAGAGLPDIAGVEGGDAFKRAFDAFVERFGYRANGEIDFSRPRWREDPSQILVTLRGNLASGEIGEHRARLSRLVERREEAARRLVAKAGQGALGPLKRALVDRLIRTMRGFLAVREYPKHGLAKTLVEVREQALAAGRALVGEGRLRSAEDVFFLDLDELTEALGDEARPIEVDIEARRAAFERHGRMQPPHVLTSDGEAVSGALGREGAPAGALVGSGVSSGVVEGRARVVLDPAGVVIEKGEILVAPFCDPGWTPLFLNAAGIVMEVGGLMTHGALVAREYGIPAVTSVRGATTAIQTGQRVRLDGARGFVEVLPAV